MAIPLVVANGGKGLSHYRVFIYMYSTLYTFPKGYTG
jgi:hypothetical protein